MWLLLHHWQHISFTVVLTTKFSTGIVTMSIRTPNTATITTSQPSTTSTVTMMTNNINSVAIAVPVVVVVVLVVVCLLVVCAIATIIILYQRDKHHHHQQDTTKWVYVNQQWLLYVKYCMSAVIVTKLYTSWTIVDFILHHLHKMMGCTTTPIMDTLPHLLYTAL